MMRSLRTFVLFTVALALATATGFAQPADEVGPRVFARIGVENPHGVQAGEAGDLLLRGGFGFEWFGLLGSPDACFVGEWLNVGFLDEDIETATRYHWGGRYYVTSYWEGLNPWIALGVEHQGSDFIINQKNLTWLSIGVEPKIKPIGWVQVLWETAGWGSDHPTESRFVIDFIPARTRE